MAGFFDDLRDALATRGHRDLGAPPAGVRSAAVLAPLFLRDGEPHLLFIRRAEGAYSHAGQIAFPGGKRGARDADPLATALREAEEEVGIRGRDVEVLGRLDDYDTVVSGFRVAPFVGVIPFPYPFRSDAREVASLLEIPLSRLLDPAIYRELPIPAVGEHRTLYSYTVDENVVWGATAAMVRQFLAVVRELPSAPKGRQ